MRIHQERSVVISKWKNGQDDKNDLDAVSSVFSKIDVSAKAEPKGNSESSKNDDKIDNVRNTVIIRNTGGTISDGSVALSDCGKFIACWPFGEVELFDLTAMMDLLSKAKK